MSAHRESREKALSDYNKKRLDKLANPDHSKRKPDYQGVDNPKGRAVLEFRCAIKDMFAFGYTEVQLVKEIREIVERDEK